MNCSNVSIAIVVFKKTFATQVTLMVSFSVMYTIFMFLKRLFIIEKISAQVTLVISLTFVKRCTWIPKTQKKTTGKTRMSDTQTKPETWLSKPKNLRVMLG